MQAEVRRLKAASTKAQRSILTQVAIAVEACPWWASLLSDFLAKAPLMLEKGPSVRKFHQRLNDTALTGENCGEIVDMMRQLPVLVKMLRPGCLDDVLALLKTRLQELGKIILEEKLASKHVPAVLQVMSEACTVFPAEPLMQLYHENAATLSQAASKKALVAETCEAMTRFCAADTEDIDSWCLAMLYLHDCLHRQQLDNERLVAEASDLMARVIDNILGCLASWWPKAADLMDHYQCAGGCAWEVAKLTQDDEVVAGMSYLCSGIQLLELHEKLRAQLKAAPSLHSLQLIVDLQRKVEALQEPDGMSERLAKHELLPLVKTLREHAALDVKHAADGLSKSLHDGLAVAAQKLDETCQAGWPGSSWVEQFQGSTFEELDEFSKLTLLKVRPASLVEAYTALEEASTSYVV